MSEGGQDGLILYRTPDGKTELRLKTLEGSAWLSQAEMAELFETSVPNINIHVRNIYEEGELFETATFKKYLMVRQEGTRQVRREVDHYNIHMILAVGYRVRSPRGTQFRQWATAHLAEYLVKGFLMDDQRLKDPKAWDYFDELLKRIREIRASEKRFYQKVRDLFALSSDYQPKDEDTRLFFAETQNKLLYAVTGQTASELVLARANPDEPNRALMSWSGSRVRKQDVVVAKNYLNADEVDTLNRLVVIFLEQAELRVKERKDLTLAFWRTNVDRLLEYNDKAVLSHPGSITREEMERVAHERYERFDERRSLAEAQQADDEDLAELEHIQKEIQEGKDRA